MPPIHVAISIIYINSTPIILEVWSGNCFKTMAPLKTLGLDGMPPFFYQHFWQVVDQDVTQSVLSWLNTSIIPHLVNHIFITLIPKTKIPSIFMNIAPSIFCNGLYVHTLFCTPYNLSPHSPMTTSIGGPRLI